MEPNIAGNRIYLREFARRDISNAYLSWLNDPATVRFSNQRFRDHNYHSSLEYLHSFRGTENLFLAICLVETQSLIGTMTAYVSRHHQTADVGILIGSRTVRGKGMGKEAWQLFCEWLLREYGIRKVTGGAAAINMPMIRIMERYGMEREAVLRDQEIIEGKSVDILLYGKFGLS